VAGFATIEYRRQVPVEGLEKFKVLLGRAKVSWNPLAQQQFDKRKAKHVAALRARQKPFNGDAVLYLR